MPNLFPENSKTGGDTTANEQVWADMAGFKAAFAKFDLDAKAAEAASKDLDGFKTAWQSVLRDCTDCHTKYRKS